MKYGAEIVFISLAAFFALLGAAFAADDLFRAHMWVLFFVLAAGAAVLMRTTPMGTDLPDGDSLSLYMDGPIRYGSIATMFWGVVGLLVGVVIALELAYPDLNIEPWFNFGRMRPLHTSAVIFAFDQSAPAARRVKRDSCAVQ
jgi:cytochrome c oxidase cbb3-type subunit 1